MILYNEKCEIVLDQMDENSIDTVITDPPYGLKFMNKKWDYDVPSVDLWKKVLRVMKPGATLLCFAGTMTQHRMAVNIEDAGFILKDVIMWLYGSGFPKATDISKQLDKMAGEEREVIGKYNQRFGLSESKGWNSNNIPKNSDISITKPATDEAELWDGWKSHGLKPAYEPIIMAVKPNDGSYAENALKHGVSGLNIDAGRIQMDQNDINMRPNAKNHNTKDIKKLYEGGLTKGHAHYIKDMGLHSSKGRFPANVIFSHHPECELKGIKKVKSHNPSNNKLTERENSIYGKDANRNLTFHAKDGKEEVEDWKCHDDCPVRMLDDQSGILKSGALNTDESKYKIQSRPGNCLIGSKDGSLNRVVVDREANEGGESRFFYCAKAHKTERDLGLENFKRKEKYNDFGLKDRVENGEITNNRTNKQADGSKNNHPTVKPIKIMEYLCKLTSTPTKGNVLDPFMGSGTTGIACINTGRDFIGIEMIEEHFNIAKCRIKYFEDKKNEKVRQEILKEQSVRTFF